MPEKGKKEILAATQIQRFFRGARATRKEFSLIQLPKTKQLMYPAFVVGNDPNISIPDEHKIQKGVIDLIGTSCLRSIQLACEFGNLNSIPKLIIIDNSVQVDKFWTLIKELFEACDTQENFLENMDTLIKRLEDLGVIRKNLDDGLSLTYLIDYPSQDPKESLSLLFRDYGYDYIKSIAMSTTFIRQSWADTATFKKLKNTLQFLNIENVFAYPSNIVTSPIPCCQSCYHAYINKILENISLIQPKLTIHTNCILSEPRPTEVYILENTEINYVKDLIFSSSGIHDPEKILKMQIKAALLENFRENGMTSEILDKIIEASGFNNTISSVPREIQLEIYNIYCRTLGDYQNDHLFPVSMEDAQPALMGFGNQ